MERKRHRIFDHPILSYFILFLIAQIFISLGGSIDNLLAGFIPGYAAEVTAMGKTQMSASGIGVAIGAMVAVGLFTLWFRKEFRGMLGFKGMRTAVLMLLPVLILHWIGSVASWVQFGTASVFIAFLRAFAPGFGEEIAFRGLGVDCLIEGGQTMNPSTDDMLKAIREVHAETVYILPNNKNVILAANQAQELTEDCRVVVVPTKTVPQGITAMVSYVEGNSAEENLEAMTEAIGTVKTCEVTYAVRDTKIDGHEIHDGDIMAIGDDGILATGSEVDEVVMNALGKMVDDDSELISLYNGADFPEEKAEALAKRIEAAYSDVDVETNYGGQPIYYCILSVE